MCWSAENENPRAKGCHLQKQTMVNRCGKVAGGSVVVVMNWEIGIDIYTLICIKWITNKNLLYKKINLKSL